jgi:hypothetical protein
MGKALAVVTGRVTNPGATITALTANTGDSFTVRSFPFGSNAYIDNVWSQEATAGVVRVRSPRLHDANQAIRERVIVTNPRPLLPYPARQQLYPQDVLTFELSGGAAETDVASMLHYYEDLPGIDARLIGVSELQSRMVNLAGMEVQATTSATAAQYGGTVALNATFDNWKRNVDYAILGYLTDTTVCTVGITGPDTGQLRVGGPGTTEALVTAEWFFDNAFFTNAPYIPVVNAANIAATLLDVTGTTTATTVNVTLNVAELSGGPGGGLV